MSELKYTIHDSLPDCITVIDRNHKVVFANQAMMFGQDFFEKSIKKHLDKALAGEQVSFENFVNFPEYGGRHLDITYDPFFEEDGSISGVLVNVCDITERKLADEAAAEEALISKSMGYLAQALIEARSIDEISRLVFEKAQKITKSKDGYAGFIETQTGHLVCPAGDTDNRQKFRVANKKNIIRDSLLTNNPHDDRRLKDLPDGHIPIKRLLSVPAIFEKVVVGQISVANKVSDYTEKDQLLLERLAAMYALAIQRIRSEELLRKSEAKYNYLYNHLGDAAFIIDPATNYFLDVNEVAVQRLGYSREELLQMTPDQVNAPEFREEVTKCLDRPPHQRPSSFESVHISKSGSRAPVEVISRFIELDGRPAIFVLARDITERKEAEEKVKQHSQLLRQLTVRMGEIEESERQQLARELHDGAGQNLTALGLNLQILQNGIRSEHLPELQDRLEDSQALVQEITKQTRDVMADLRSPVLEDYGLAAALRWYGEQVSSRTGIEVVVREKPFLPLQENQLNTIFRVAKEAITNAIKHASAKQISLTLQDDGQNFQLVVEDDGVGFRPATVNSLQKERHWGIITMEERMAALGGTFRISSNPGQGSKITVEVGR